jgi:hypothetical protein
MRKISILMLVLLAALALSSCGWSNATREMNLSGDQKPAMSKIAHTNQSIKMEVLDELPQFGIIIVRFIDAGHTRYLAISKDQLTVMSTNSTGGKNPQYEDESLSTRK